MSKSETDQVVKEAKEMFLNIPFVPSESQPIGRIRRRWELGPSPRASHMPGPFLPEWTWACPSSWWPGWPPRRGWHLFGRWFHPKTFYRVLQYNVKKTYITRRFSFVSVWRIILEHYPQRPWQSGLLSWLPLSLLISLFICALPKTAVCLLSSW